MSFQRIVPQNLAEFRHQLDAVFKNVDHVRNIQANPSNRHLEVTFDSFTHRFQHGDFYYPLRVAHLTEARELLERMRRELSEGFAPSESQVGMLFDMIDPAGQ